MADSTRPGADGPVAPQRPAGETVWEDPLVDVAVSHHAGSTVVLAVRGQIDLSSAPALADALSAVLAESPARVLVEMSQVSFLGVAGVRELAGAAREARAAGSELFVVDPARPVARILRLVGLDRGLVHPEPLARITDRGDDRP